MIVYSIAKAKPWQYAAGEIIEKTIRLRKRHHKTVYGCYSMDSCACGFETRASPSDSLAATAHFISWNDATVHDVLFTSSPDSNRLPT